MLNTVSEGPMDVFSKREPIIREVAAEVDVDPQLILDLLTLETEFKSLHAYGARGRLRRAAEKLIDAAMPDKSGSEGS